MGLGRGENIFRKYTFELNGENIGAFNRGDLVGIELILCNLRRDSIDCVGDDSAELGFDSAICTVLSSSAVSSSTLTFEADSFILFLFMKL